VRVLVTGATGFIGRHLAYALASAGHEVICCARDPAQPQRRLAGLSWVHADLTRDFSPGDWLLRLQAVDAVVNAEGILGEAGTQTLEALHVRAPQALFAACVNLNRCQKSRAGVRARS
jgi:nucleoside-diphosphate-sugar epimerase